MENISPQQLLKIWQKGKTLNNAVWAYCDKKYIDAFSVKLPKTASGKIEDTGSFMGNLIEVAGSFAETQMKQKEHFTKKEAARNNLKNNLYDKITNGELIAVGYEVPVQSNFPTSIPLHMWPPEEADMGESSISANERDFIRVRIIQKAEIEKIISPKKEQEVIPKYEKRGRPTVKNALNQIYAEMKADDSMDYSTNLKENLTEIKVRFRRKHPFLNDGNVEYSAVNDHLGDRYKIDKKAWREKSVK